MNRTHSGLSRRNFLSTTGRAALTTVVSLPGFNLLHAQEVNPIVSETKPEPGELAKARGYQGATKEELLRTAGRDIRMNILNSLTKQDYLTRTHTAIVPEDSLGYVDDLCELAVYQIKEKGAGQAAKILDDIEKFGKEIKSARLATLITAATILEYPILSKDDGKLITSLEGLLKPVDAFLKLGYRKLSLIDKLEAENTIIEAIYGAGARKFLSEKFTSNQYNPKVIKDLIKEVNKIKAKPAIFVEPKVA